MARELLDDCFLHDKDRLKHHEALDILRRNITPLDGSETISLFDATGRVCAEDVISPRNVPLTNNAAVDGYAFAHSDYVTQNGRLKIGERLAAGRLDIPNLKSEEAARIFTGAVMPDNADTVAMQEDCSIVDGFVTIPSGLKHGANHRRAGEDTSEGDSVLSRGKRITIQDVTAISSLGLTELRVQKKIQVGIFSTGDELVKPGEPIQQGQVYNSNAPLLEELLKTLPVAVTNIGILPDDAASIKNALKQLGDKVDVIITTGGASRGEEDHIIDVLDDIGTRHLWQLAIKPGRPMTFGNVGKAKFIGLPGNPVAAFVCFLLYCRPVILRLAGADWADPFAYQLPADFEIPKKKTDRREFLRGILVPQQDGTLRVKKYERDGSGLISGLRAADGLIEIDENANCVSKGELVRFIPFSSFGLPT